MSLEALLERWAGLEPERCQIIDRWAPDPVLLITSDNPHGWRVGVGPWSRPTIQSAVQEAIEARGWHWLVGHSGDNGRMFGCVTLPQSPKARPLSRENGDSPAVALLAAYLAAIEAREPA